MSRRPAVYGLYKYIKNAKGTIINDDFIAMGTIADIAQKTGLTPDALRNYKKAPAGGFELVKLFDN